MIKKEVAAAIHAAINRKQIPLYSNLLITRFEETKVNCEHLDLAVARLGGTSEGGEESRMMEDYHVRLRGRAFKPYPPNN